MTKTDDQKRIDERYPGIYSGPQMESALESLISPSMDSEIRLHLEKFLTSGVLEDLTVEAYSVTRLKKEHGMNELAAFLTLDWLKREPEDAKASLAKGSDWVR